MTRVPRWPALVLAAAVVALVAASLGPPGRAGGPTYVAGEVTGMWTAEGSPYVVTRDAYVPPSRYLHIGPGVEVRFDPAVALTVTGTLVVEGSPEGPVLFTSNGSTTPGSWGGLVVKGSAFIHSASIELAEVGIQISGGTAEIRRISVSNGGIGLVVNRSSAIVADSSFSRNEVAGAEFVSSNVDLDRLAFSTNGWGVMLVGSAVSITNGSIDGSAIGDADLAGSRLTLRNTTRTGVLQSHDAESSVTERWFAHVFVKDRFGSAVAGASVTVDGGGLPSPIQTTTGVEGWARWLDLAGRVTGRSGASSPTYRFTAAADATTASVFSGLSGETRIGIPLDADLAAPVADAGPDLSATEGSSVSFDASRSRDNDPTFPEGASFDWRFDDNGRPVVLSGISATYAFALPGTYPIVLYVGDAAGNTGTDLLLVRVLDTTAPVARIALPTQSYAGERVVLDGRGSTDNDPAFNETGNFTWTLESAGGTWTRYGRLAEFSGPAGEYAVTLRVRDAGGNWAVTTASLRIVPRPSIDLAWLAAAFAAWFAALGIAGTERGRMAFLSWFVLPLFTRMKKEEVLDQFTRGQIYGYIVVHPGDSYIDIKRNLQLNNGTLTHHLNVLERDGLIRSKNVGTRKLFFAAGARVPEDGGGMHEVQQQILRHLKESGGLPVNDVAGAIGISRQLAIYHLRDLSRRGLVRIERRAFRIVAYAEETQGRPPA